MIEVLSAIGKDTSGIELPGFSIDTDRERSISDKSSEEFVFISFHGNFFEAINGSIDLRFVKFTVFGRSISDFTGSESTS